MKTNRKITGIRRFDSRNFDTSDIAVFIKRQFHVVFASDCPFFVVPDFVVFFHGSNYKACFA